MFSTLADVFDSIDAPVTDTLAGPVKTVTAEVAGNLIRGLVVMGGLTARNTEDGYTFEHAGWTLDFMMENCVVHIYLF